MPPSDDDESFDEFDLNDLPEDALDELESNAIQFTQAQHNAPSTSRVVAAAGSDYGDDFEDDDLDDNVVIDESRSTPALNPTFQPRHSSQHSKLPQRSASVAPVSQINFERRSVPPPPLFNHSQQSIVLPQCGSEPPPYGSQTDKLTELQRQLDAITRERNALKEDLNSKTGEIAIVRSKHDKTVKEHERELTILRKQNAEATAKQQRELEAARQSERAAAVERDFLKQDTAEAVRARRVAQVKEKTTTEPLTPRKKKLLAHRDGFDDDEIEFLSPSKNSPNKLRKTSTPTKPGKRKRKVPDSPAGPLEVIDAAEPAPPPPPQSFLAEELLKKLSVQDDRYDFLSTMLDHKFDSQHKRTVEELAQYSIPSCPEESLQSAILAAIPKLGRQSVDNLPIEFCQLIIQLWKSCTDERYFAPVYLFVDMLTFAFQLKPTFIAPRVIDDLAPLITRLIHPLLMKRFREFYEPEPHDTKTGSTAGLSLLYLTALGCMGEEKDIVRLWRFQNFDITLVVWSSNQNMADMELMLKLLSTSVTTTSFGAPSEDESSECTIFTALLDKLTLFMVSVPTKPYSIEKYDPATVSNFRIQILQLFISMTRSPYASKFMAQHKDLIGRLVKLISDELDALYDYKPGRDASIRIINLATRLLYHLVTRYEESINMNKKLSVIPGGNQKYLLSLARLNFSEDDLVLEAGIDADVATCALELLELFVTPEEGDAIHAAFSSQ